MHFGENQLSRSLIGLSPLPTGHPPGFQPWWVRSSTRSYPRFNLPMGRSLRFGSIACDSNALFRLAFATAPPHGLTLPHTITRRLILQKARGHFTSARMWMDCAPAACRRTVSGAISRPLTGALFTFPSRYWFTIGHQGVFRLRRWSSQIHTGFLGPRATWDTARKSLEFRLRGCHPLCRRFPDVFGYSNDFLLPARSAALARRSHNPGHATPAGCDTRPVWPVPFSLTTTQGIAVAFSSCGY